MPKLTKRVIDEARDPNNKLLERIKFLSIVSSNIDEFFMVRVAALKQKLAKRSPDLSIDGKAVAFGEKGGWIEQQGCIAGVFNDKISPGGRADLTGWVRLLQRLELSLQLPQRKWNPHLGRNEQSLDKQHRA